MAFLGARCRGRLAFPDKQLGGREQIELVWRRSGRRLGPQRIPAPVLLAVKQNLSSAARPLFTICWAAGVVEGARTLRGSQHGIHS